jgi:hypothetical protein
MEEKKRGSHLHWKFNETSPDDIAQTVKKLKEAEEKKIPFIIKNTFKIIRERWPKRMTNISLHWGIGCDAMGKKLSNGDNSFLVCDAVRIPEIDHTSSELKKSLMFLQILHFKSLNVSQMLQCKRYVTLRIICRSIYKYGTQHAM